MKKILDILAWTPLGWIIVPILLFHSSLDSKYYNEWWLFSNAVVLGIETVIILTVLIPFDC